MRKPKDPFTILNLLNKMIARSTCQVQVAALLIDNNNNIVTGWNNSGADGYGEHAEAMAIRRANPRRLAASTLYVCAKRNRNGRPVTSCPCMDCWRLLKGINKVVFRDGKGEWQTFERDANRQWIKV